MKNSDHSVTAPVVRAMKVEGRKVVCVTAYDACFGAIAEEAGADIVLVGDSLGNVVFGYKTTLPVTLEEVEHHVRATRAGVDRALLVADMPFGSYGASVAQAVESAARLVKAGADAVKLEGPFVSEVEAILRTGVPVMGHVGMTPQSVNVFGGHKVQGKGDSEAGVVAAAKALDRAGVFSMVLELVPRTLASKITHEVGCPTIGIGAGADCDGQVQVLHDVLGLAGKEFRHAKTYVEGRRLFVKALATYAQEVRDGKFPLEENSF